MNGDPIYYCALCQRMLHASQVRNGTHPIMHMQGDGYRLEEHPVTPMGNADDRPIVVRLTAEEATLAKQAIALMVIQVMRDSPGDPRVAVLSGIVVRLQLAKEVAQ